MLGRHVILRFVSRRGGELLMLDVARNTGRNVGRREEAR
jgi:hypothetical protein